MRDLSPDSRSIAESIEAKEVIRLSQELIRIPSVYHKEHRISKFIYKRLEKWGLAPECVEVPGYGPNVVAEIGSTKARSVVMNGHMDTVEVMQGWKHDPFGAEIEGGLLYGLGSLDMKCGLACMMTAFRTLHEQGVGRKGRLVFQAVSGEEHKGLGTRTLVEAGMFRRADCVMVGEGFGGLNAITNGRRGASYYDIHVEGRSAHGATPELGINAIADAARIIDELSRSKRARSGNLVGDDFRPLAGTQTVLRISGGGDSLSVPERCSIHMVRYSLPGEDVDATAELGSLVRSLKLKSKVTIRMQTGVDLYYPSRTSPNSNLVKAAVSSIRHFTGKTPRLVIGVSEADDNIIAYELGVPVICVGPGETGRLARYHQPEEAIPINQLGPAAKVHCATALQLMN